MEFGLIEINRVVALRHRKCKLHPSVERRRPVASDDDGNVNANTHRSGSNPHRPSPSTSNSRTGMLGDCRTRSTASLTKSISFETPFGVVRQSSSSTIEPETIHSVTSQESFRRDIGLYKMQLMPALTEDGDLSDEEGKNEVDIHNMRKFARKGRHSQKGKTKSTKNTYPEELEEIEVEQDSFDNIDIDSNENESDVQQREVCERKLNKGKLIERVMKLFSCTGKQDKDTFELDGEMLIQSEVRECAEDINDKHGDKT